jgi:hypothetical protein
MKRAGGIRGRRAFSDLDTQKSFQAFSKMASGAQIRLEDIPGVRELRNVAHQPFEQSEVKFPDQDRSDASMFREVIGNRMLSEGFMAGRGLAATWDMYGVILRAFVEPVKWRGSDQYRSSLGIPLLAENFYSSLSVFQQQLFASYEPFKIEETVSSSMEVADAQQALIEAQLKMAAPRGSSAKQEVRAIAYDCLFLGTGVGLMAWEQRKISKRKVRLKAGYTPKSIPLNSQGSTATVHPPDDAYEEYVDEYTCNYPILEHIPLRRVRVSPDCYRGNIRTAKWRGRIMYLSAYDLDQFRDCEGYKIPTREQLIKLTTPQKDRAGQNVMDTQTGSTNTLLQRMPTSQQQAYPEWLSESSTLDPLAQPFEVFEYFTNDRVCWVLENQAVIRNANHDGRDMVSFTFREAPDSFFGYGMGMWLSDFQRIAQGVVNYFFDDLNLNLAGVYTSEQGMNNTAQAAWIYPGKVFKTTGPEGLKAMTRNTTQGQEPLAVIAQVKAWASAISGAGAGVQGANPGATGDMRTGIGVQTLAQGEGMKMQDLIDQFCDLVFIPFLEFCVENNKRLTPSQLRQILNDTLSGAMKADPIDMINATYKITISAGARLQARNSLNQSLGYIQSILQQPGLTDQLAAQAVKIDYKALVGALFNSTGFPYQQEIIVPMTDEDKARAAQAQGMNAGAMKMATIAAQGKQKIAAQDNQAENRALLEVQKKMFEKVDLGQPAALA